MDMTILENNSKSVNTRNLLFLRICLMEIESYTNQLTPKNVFPLLFEK